MKPETDHVAILPWGDLIEDYLGDIGLSLDSFCQEMTGGWLFGYIEALQHVDIQSSVFCFSAHVTAPVRRAHVPTGATICILPASKNYLRMRRFLRDPYGWSMKDMFGAETRVPRFGQALIRDVAPYLATPLWLLISELRRQKCTAILCQEYEYARFDICVAAGKLLGVPVFATFQGGNWQLSRLEGLLRPRTIQACHGLIIAPKTEEGRVRKKYDVPADDIAQIFNPLDMTVWKAQNRIEARVALELPSTSRIAIWHGRVDMHRKGLDVLLKAWKQVYSKQNAQDLRLLMVGTGPDAEKMRQYISEMQLRGIHWINKYVLDRAEIRRYLSSADVYVFPSRHEGFPVALMEAMACGLPSVAAAAPGVPDILEGEESGGIMVPPDDVNAMASALGSLLADKVRSRKLGTQAQRRAASCFSHKAVGRELRSFLAKPTEPCSSETNLMS